MKKLYLLCSIIALLLLGANMYVFQIGLQQSKNLKTQYLKIAKTQEELHRHSLIHNQKLSFENLEKIAQVLNLEQTNNIKRLDPNDLIDDISFLQKGGKDL